MFIVTDVYVMKLEKDWILLILSIYILLPFLQVLLQRRHLSVFGISGDAGAFGKTTVVGKLKMFVRISNQM